MKTMERFEGIEQIARLDGFLAGVAACNGSLRDYTSFSYIVDCGVGTSSIERSLKDHFSWLPDLELSKPEPIEGGLRELEIAIRPFLVRESSNVGAEKAVQLQKYLSFRTMELISSAIATYEVVEVIKISALPEPSSSDAVFFCIRLKNWLVVLQFNDDAEFKRSHDA